jgi:intracellular septation protein
MRRAIYLRHFIGESKGFSVALLFVEMSRMPKKLSPTVKLLCDFAPLAVFFVAYKLGGVMTATVALMVATSISIALVYAVERKIALAPLISGGLVMVMGGLSVALNDEQFIKIKPTLVNLLFAAVLLGGVVIAKRGLLKYVLDVAFQLTDAGWLVLSKRWGFFFVFLAVLNEVIWRNFSTEFWVNFKVFGMFTLTIAFAISQFKLVEKYKLPQA